jgi:predicted nucleic acid-binding protein
LIAYAESSAVLSWLLNEEDGPRVVAIFDQAELIVASRLTLVECRRALHRVGSAEASSPHRSRMLEQRLRAAAATWLLLDLDEETLEKASSEFPEEPVRTLDAVHLASAAILFETLDDLAIVSLDRRVRVNAAKLGLQVLPSD